MNGIPASSPGFKNLGRIERPQLVPFFAEFREEALDHLQGAPRILYSKSFNRNNHHSSRLSWSLG
jgi:hypothetical protein